MASDRRRRLDPKDYTVVWVAPLEVEAKACLGVLDKHHIGFFEVQDGQDYLFTGGELNGHNIIVATLPKGQNYGPVSASALINQAKLLFPSKLILLVGVAAGIPKLDCQNPKEDRDIRLGDVLVAIPEKSRPSIICYDSGTQTNTDFILTSRQDDPLTIFRSAYSFIELNYPNPFRRGGLFDQDLKIAQTKLANTYLNDDFTCPPAEQDILHVYQDDEDTEGRAVARKSRGPSTQPRVWFGSLGSGNKLMRNHQERDRLRDKYDIIGLEMEAAGVMNSSQAAVIRGVCDYGDRKKNKDWQGFAAVVAAVYAKAVLMVINPTKLKRTEAQSDHDLNVHHSQPPERQLPFPPVGNKEQQKEASNIPVASEDGQNILNWLSQHDHISRWQAYLSSHQRGTGRWMFDTSEYLAWRSNDHHPVLLCQGIIGAGKSTMMALAAQHLIEESHSNHAVGVIFFNKYKDTSGSLNGIKLLAALAKQLIERKTYVSAAVIRLFKNYQLNSQNCLTMNAIYSVLIAEIAQFEKVIFLIDGLDECLQQARLEMLKNLSELQVTCPGLMIMLSTRTIDCLIEEVTEAFDVVSEFNIRAQRADLHAYINEQFEMRASLREARRHKGLIEQLTNDLVHEADGMFLLVVLSLRLLEAQKPTTRQEFVDSFSVIQGSDKLRDTYYAMWKLIMAQEKQAVDLARNVFAWISFSIQPLTIEQLSHAVVALATKDSHDCITNEVLFHKSFITKSCLGLVTIKEGGIVDFCHMTAREIIPSFSQHMLLDLQEELCRACLRYLNQEGMGTCESSAIIEQQLEDFPLLSYAATAWAAHAAAAHERFRLGDLLTSLSNNELVGRTARIVSFIHGVNDDTMYGLPQKVSALHLVAFHGLNDVLQHIINRGFQKRVEFDTSHLIWTLALLVSIELLRLGYSWFSQGHATDMFHFASIQRIVLTLAVIFGTTARTPLMQRPDSNTQDSRGWTILRWAAWQEQTDTMRMLIQMGADVDLQCEKGWTTLSWALGQPRWQESGTSPPGRYVQSGTHTQFHYGSIYRLPECALYPDWIMPQPTLCSHAVVHLLIQHTRDIDATDALGKTALMLAADLRQFEHVQHLLKRGANNDLKDSNGMTALLFALRTHYTIVRTAPMTLGADIMMHIGDRIIVDIHRVENTQDVEVSQVVLNLVGKKSIEAKDFHGRSALAMAAANGLDYLVKELLEMGADADSSDAYKNTPLVWACSPVIRGSFEAGPLYLSGRAKVTQGTFLELHGPEAFNYLLKSIEKERHNRLLIVQRLAAILQFKDDKWRATIGLRAWRYARAAQLHAIMSTLERAFVLPVAGAGHTNKGVIPEPSNASPNASRNLVNLTTTPMRNSLPSIGTFQLIVPSKRSDPNELRDRSHPSLHHLSFLFPDLQFGPLDQIPASPAQPPHKPPLVVNADDEEQFWHDYGDVEVTDGDDWTIFNGDLVIATGTQASSTISAFQSAPGLIAQLPSATLKTGKIKLRDSSIVVRGDLIGDANCTLETMWQNSKLRLLIGHPPVG